MPDRGRVPPPTGDRRHGLPGIPRPRQRDAARGDAGPEAPGAGRARPRRGPRGAGGLLHGARPARGGMGRAGGGATALPRITRSLMAKTEGPRDLAVAVVEAAIASLRDRPNQMNITISNVGFQASNTGGIGYNISPHISGAGGSFTGIEVKGLVLLPGGATAIPGARSGAGRAGRPPDRGESGLRRPAAHGAGEARAAGGGEPQEDSPDFEGQWLAGPAEASRTTAAGPRLGLSGGAAERTMGDRCDARLLRPGRLVSPDGDHRLLRPDDRRLASLAVRRGPDRGGGVGGRAARSSDR